MTGPMTGIAGAQPMQQTLPDQGSSPVGKAGKSKFDAVLADKAGKAQAGKGTEVVSQVEGVAKPERATLNLVSHVVSELEQGQQRLDKLIDAGMSGKSFSNAELLSLQASMYKYTLELDLTSKVVEKATSGLKDVVKTQV